MPLTYLGLEVNFCEECGKELVEHLSIDKLSIFLSCPDRLKGFSRLLDAKLSHSYYYMGPNTAIRKFNPTTGEREKNGV